MQSDGEDLAHATSFEALQETQETTLARVLKMSDRIPQKPQLLNSIGDTFIASFRSTRDEGDINNSVLAYQLAVQLLPVTDAEMAGFYGDYGVSVFERYNLTGTLADIDQAILSQRKAVQLTPEGHAHLPIWLNHLGASLQIRFERTGDLADISEAIELQLKFIQLTPEDDADLPVWLSNLGVSLRTRFERTGDLVDISEAISVQRKSIDLTPQDHPDLPTRLNNLAVSLQPRFERTGDLADISEAISYQRQSVQLTSEGHADLPLWLINLGSFLRTFFDHTGDLSAISDAISSQRKSIQLTPEGHADLPVRMNHLGSSLRARFARTGDLADISESISLERRSIQLTPEGHARLHVQLNNLGSSLRASFVRTGDLAEISEAISVQQKSIQLIPEGHADLLYWLNSLGVSLETRFMRTGDLADVSEAISLQRKSIQLTPEGHAHLPLRQNCLGCSLHARFERTGDLADISEAISLERTSIRLTPEGHPHLTGWLHSLGLFLQARFQRTGDLADISEAISSQQKAVQLTPEGHPDLPVRLNNLGISLQTRFQRTRNLGDVSEAISFQQKAVQLTPEGHADLPVWLFNLGSFFAARFEHTPNAVDGQHAILHYRLSATSSSGPPSTRLSAAKAWAHWSQKTDQSQLLGAYCAAIRLISQVVSLDQTIHNRYSNLKNISELSSSAAAAAMELGHHSLALEWLEQGRCLVWNQLNDLRTPIDDLREHNPSLADDVVRVSRALENAGSRAERQPVAFAEEINMTTTASIQDDAHTHIKLAQEWDRLLVQVRAIPKFEDFLRPASCSTLLKNLPDFGHVVVINVDKDRSDALVLTSGATEPLHIALPKFPHERADNLRRDLKALLIKSRMLLRGFEHDLTRGPFSRRYKEGVADILNQLWACVVQPILNGLGYSVPASKLPRIWWCATGPLAFLPIHAAGVYASAKSTPGIYTSLPDFTISSYIPTVRSLVEKNQKYRAISQEKAGLLMISQPDTPGQCPIPGTTIEVMAIQRLLANHEVEHICLESSDATVIRVKDKMDAYSCIHFACHAAQDTTKPLQSGFHLYDGRLDLSAIIKENLIGADLAFLSACQTSTGDEKLSEEAVHLAGGMLAAGYRGVVATMWAIEDDYGPRLAEEFYKNLISHGGEDKTGSTRLSGHGAAHALHYATQQVRKTLDNSESSLLTWVPYVHFGL